MFGHSSISDAKFQHVASVLAGSQATTTFLLLFSQNGSTMMRTAVLITLLLSQRSLSLFGLANVHIQISAPKTISIHVSSKWLVARL